MERIVWHSIKYKHILAILLIITIKQRKGNKNMQQKQMFNNSTCYNFYTGDMKVKKNLKSSEFMRQSFLKAVILQKKIIWRKRIVIA